MHSNGGRREPGVEPDGSCGSVPGGHDHHRRRQVGRLSVVVTV